jgi:hypothetical protein
MAIQGTYTFKGLSVPNAFVRVLSLTGGENGWTANIGVFASTVEPTPLETYTLMTPYRAGADPIGDVEDTLLSKPEYMGFVRVSPKRITRLEFLNRFTQEERVAIRTAAKNVVALEDYLALVNVAQFVDVTRADTIGGVQYLENAGLLQVGRANVILGLPPAEEPPVGE